MKSKNKNKCIAESTIKYWAVTTFPLLISEMFPLMLYISLLRKQTGHFSSACHWLKYFENCPRLSFHHFSPISFPPVLFPSLSCILTAQFLFCQRALTGVCLCEWGHRHTQCMYLCICVHLDAGVTILSFLRCSPFLLLDALSFLMVSFFSFFLRDRNRQIPDRQRDWGRGHRHTMKMVNFWPLPHCLTLAWTSSFPCQQGHLVTLRLTLGSHIYPKLWADQIPSLSWNRSTLN